MSQKIAVIADIHLSNIPGTPQEAALIYTLTKLQAENPDIVLIIGDITADGTMESANRFYTMLHKSGLCFRMIPGNSDERTPGILPAVTDRLTVDTPFYGNGYAVCLLDIHKGKETIGYHLHQVILVDGIMKNHYPIMDVYGPLISLSSFFWGWKTGCLCHAPMYLEIRSDNVEDTVDSLQYIRQHMICEIL